ncbi:MAG: FAD-binding protein [Deltaproteobacteria bacterium]|nr:FAD-binding protein [Deltaproteobacteria bacterium]
MTKGCINHQAAIIARGANAEEVRRSFDFAREHALTAAVRSGGGSVPGQSICDGGIVIDVSPMKEVAIKSRR